MVPAKYIIFVKLQNSTSTNDVSLQIKKRSFLNKLQTSSFGKVLGFSLWSILLKCGALCDSIPFVQFKKREFWIWPILIVLIKEFFLREVKKFRLLLVFSSWITFSRAFKLNGFWIAQTPWSPSLQNSFPYYSC